LKGNRARRPNKRLQRTVLRGTAAEPEPQTRGHEQTLAGGLDAIDLGSEKPTDKEDVGCSS